MAFMHACTTNHQYISRAENHNVTSPPQSHLGRAPRSHTTMQQSPHWLRRDASNSSQNCTFPFDDCHSHLIHPSLDRPHSPPKTASGSTQPFCHSTLSGQTDRQTDGWSRRETCTNTRLRSIDYSDAANNNKISWNFRNFKARFLADRTIGRAYGTVCRLSVCLSACRLSVCL